MFLRKSNTMNTDVSDVSDLKVFDGSAVIYKILVFYVSGETVLGIKKH